MTDNLPLVTSFRPDEPVYFSPKNVKVPVLVESIYPMINVASNRLFCNGHKGNIRLGDGYVMLQAGARSYRACLPCCSKQGIPTRDPHPLTIVEGE